MSLDHCEADLIERAVHGDQDAFRQLWEQHHPKVMASALRLCHQRTMAEEITQGAFLLAWRGLPSFQCGHPFRPWLMRILYRHALDVIERQKSYLRPLSLDSITEYEQISTYNTAQDLQELVAQREELRVVLARLAPDQHRVIALRYGADLTESEISAVLGWPVGTVKSRLNRARERCRTLLLAERK